MLKTLIVDDEKIIREGLKAFIDWEGIGYNVAGEAANGQEALDLINKIDVQLVIVDINMPIMNGLEFIKRLRQNSPHIKVIILTGYSDFEFLQEALKYRVENYLLKPIDENELMNSLLFLKEEILSEIEEQQYQKESLIILRDKVLNRLVTQSISVTEFIEKANFLNITLTGNTFTVILIELDDVNQLTKARDICTQIMNQEQKGVLFEDMHQRVVYMTGESIERDLYEAAKKVQEALKEAIDEEAVITISSQVQRLSLLYQAYNEAVELLEFQFFMGRNTIIFKKAIPSSDLTSNIELKSQLTEFLKSIRAHDSNEALQIIHSLFQTLKEKKQLNKTAVQNIAFDLIINAVNLVKEANGNIDSLFGHSTNMYHEILTKQTIDELITYLCSTTEKIIDYLTTLKNERPVKVIDTIIEHIETNYEKDLTLKQLANMVYMNPSYLGKLFKKETGYNYNDFLNKTRVEKAKDLILNSSYLLYEICEMVGYKEYNYFYKTFKKHIGVSPSDLK
jgi:two-component system, response regulator YesN